MPDKYAKPINREPNPEIQAGISRIMQSCREQIRHEMDAGDPNGQVWEIICNGPDELKRYGVKSLHVVDHCNSLRQFAESRGWDEQKDVERRREYIMQFGGKMRQVQQAWNARPGRVTG